MGEGRRVKIKQNRVLVRKLFVYKLFLIFHDYIFGTILISPSLSKFSVFYYSLGTAVLFVLLRLL